MSTDTAADQAFVAATQGYYRDPRPALAARACARALEMLASTPPEGFLRFGPLLYLFGRIARESDAARAALAEVVARYRGQDVPLVTRIIEVDAPFPDALTMPVDDAVHVDLLWAEFFATGRRDAIARIVALLDSPDRVARRAGLAGRRPTSHPRRGARGARARGRPPDAHDPHRRRSRPVGLAHRRARHPGVRGARLAARRRHAGGHQGLRAVVATAERARPRAGRRGVPRRGRAPWRPRSTPVARAGWRRGTIPAVTRDARRRRATARPAPASQRSMLSSADATSHG